MAEPSTVPPCAFSFFQPLSGDGPCELQNGNQNMIIHIERVERDSRGELTSAHRLHVLFWFCLR